MKIDDVPQQPGIIDDGRKEVCYAVNENGQYTLAGSAGWEPKNIANRQAWELIDAAAAETLKKVQAGRASPLAYHMARHQMGICLLSNYSGFGRLKVWLHMRPKPFRRLTADALKRYADVFDISVDELTAVPKKHVSRSRRDR